MMGGWSQVFRFDHHCYWMGTCIGARNLRWFMLFVGAQALTYVYGVFFLRTLPSHQPRNPSAWLCLTAACVQ